MSNTLVDFCDMMTELSDEDYEKLSLVVMTEYLIHNNCVVISAGMVKEIIKLFPNQPTLLQRGMERDLKNSLKALDSMREVSNGSIA